MTKEKFIYLSADPPALTHFIGDGTCSGSYEEQVRKFQEECAKEGLEVEVGKLDGFRVITRPLFKITPNPDTAAPPTIAKPKENTFLRKKGGKYGK